MKISLNFSLSHVPHEDMHFGGDYHRGDAPFSSHLIREYMIPKWFITRDVNLDHLVKVVSVRFPHYKVTMFPFHILFIRSELVGLAHTQREGNYDPLPGERSTRVYGHIVKLPK